MHKFLCQVAKLHICSLLYFISEYSNSQNPELPYSSYIDFHVYMGINGRLCGILNLLKIHYSHKCVFSELQKVIFFM